MRYNRLKDIGLSDSLIKENLLFTAEKVGEPMKIAMTKKDRTDARHSTLGRLEILDRT